MKAVAYLLLVVGFFWLLFGSVHSQTSTVVVMSNRYEKLPKEESFSRREMEQIMRQEWSACRQQRPWIFTPGCLMLVGAIILDRLTRRRAPDTKPSNQAMQRTAPRSDA